MHPLQTHILLVCMFIWRMNKQPKEIPNFGNMHNTSYTALHCRTMDHKMYWLYWKRKGSKWSYFLFNQHSSVWQKTQWCNWHRFCFESQKNKLWIQYSTCTIMNCYRGICVWSFSSDSALMYINWYFDRSTYNWLI